MSSHVRTAISETAIDLTEHVAWVSTSSAGAVATFLGQVRDHDAEAPSEVSGLDYSAHPDAADVLAGVVADVLAELGSPAVRVAVSHRVGSLAVGDAAIVAAVASAHRAEAFTVCRVVVDAVKERVPIWKRQHLTDGGHVWSGIS